jgi:hypothetical protein
MSHFQYVIKTIEGISSSLGFGRLAGCFAKPSASNNLVLQHSGESVAGPSFAKLERNAKLESVSNSFAKLSASEGCLERVVDFRWFGIWGLYFSVWDLYFRIWDLYFRVQGLDFGIWNLYFRVWGLHFKVQDLYFRVWGLYLRVQGLHFRFWGLDFRVLGLYFRVWGSYSRVHG